MVAYVGSDVKGKMREPNNGTKGPNAEKRKRRRARSFASLQKLRASQVVLRSW